MNCTDKIRNVTARFINKELDGKIEVKVHVVNHTYYEANIRIDKKELINAGAPNFRTNLRKVEKWMNQNKDFVFEQIKKQYPTFWEEQSLHFSRKK